MGFMLNRYCRCCQTASWHCRDCWNKYHNGERDNDFIERPAGTSLFVDNPDIEKRFKKLMEDNFSVIDKIVVLSNG